MKLTFKKGWNKDKPKRWYLFADQGKKMWPIGMHGFDPDKPLVLEANYAVWDLERKLKEYNIHFCREREYEYLTWPKYLYVYYKCYADEAEFIVKMSGGIEI